MSDSGNSSDGTEHVDDLGYPREELETLLGTAEYQYRVNVDEHGPGKNWLHPDAPEARWHIWKACDELFQARDHANDGRYVPANRHFADALNHMLMAMERTRHERPLHTETDRPVSQSENSTRNGGGDDS